MKIEHLLSDSTTLEGKRRSRTKTANPAGPATSTVAPPQAATASPVTTTPQAGPVTSPTPVNLTATPAPSNVPATAPAANGQDSKWERVKRFGSQAVDALGSVGRGVSNVAKTVGSTVGDVATAAGDVAGGVGNLASRAVGGVAQTVGAVPGGLKAGYRGQSYKTNGPDYGSSNSSHQWGSSGASSSNAAPDEVDDLRSTIRSMDQRLRRAGI